MILVAAVLAAFLFGTDRPEPPAEFVSALRESMNSDAEWKMEKTLPQLKMSVKSSGVVSCLAKQGIRWETRKPFKTLLVMDKSGLSKTNDGETAALEVPFYSRIRAAIDDALDGDPSKIQSIFETVESKIDREQKTFLVHLKPTDSRLAGFIRKIEIGGTADGQKNELTRTVFEFADGSLTTINFTKLPTHGTLWQ